MTHPAKQKVCPECRSLVHDWNEQCKDCGFEILIEPTDKARARYLRRPSLGALLWTQGWAVGARLYIWFLLSLIPIVGVAVLILLVIFGRRWSWKRGSWGSWEEFTARMRVMDWIGAVWVAALVLVYLLLRQ